MNVRVRYAPSPTGLQHIGGVRTALFNYFFAKASQGTFILRVEDTDRTRTSPESMNDLKDTFEWLGIMWDEGPGRDGGFGPYIQSERKDIYQSHIQGLIDNGKVYRCFCSEERVEQVREQQRAEKRKIIGYDRHCRDLSSDESAKRAADGEPFVIRFKVPIDGETSFNDVLLGEITRKNEDINPDPVMVKRDGYPTYHFANVIDDHLMEISHVIRAQEWIPSGPLHVLIYRAFGWDLPLYCHLPMVLGTDGKKLGKRHGSTSLREFRQQGYLPETIINAISLLGWSYDDSREYFAKEDLEQLFTLEKINKASAVFDYKKLDWFNGYYIREKSDDDLAELVMPYLTGAGIMTDPPADGEVKMLKKAIPLVKERLKTLSEATESLGFLFGDVTLPSAETFIPKKMDLPGTLAVVKSIREFLPGFADRDDEENETLFREKSEELGVKLGNMLMPLRVALTGTRVSPPLFESMRLLGESTCVERLDKAIELLERKD